MNGIRIDTIEKFRMLDEKEQIEALFELSLENVKQCKCRLKQCQKNFIEKMVIKDKRLPVSKFSFWFLSGVAIFFAGAGIIEPHRLVKWAKVVFSFL